MKQERRKMLPLAWNSCVKRLSPSSQCLIRFKTKINQEKMTTTTTTTTKQQPAQQMHMTSTKMQTKKEEARNLPNPGTKKCINAALLPIHMVGSLLKYF